MSFLRLQGYAALLFCVLYRSNCCCRSFFRFEQMHSQSPQRQQIQIKGNCDTDVWRTNGSQRHGSCNGPGDHGRYDHHRIFQIQAKEDFSGLFSPHSWLVSMMARVWLQEMAEVTMEVSKVVP